MVQGSSTAPTKDADQERRRILAAASDIFRRNGYHATGMRDIASAMGIAVGKLYYYFASKHDLLAYCQRECLARLLGIARRVQGLQLDPASELELLVIGHLRALNEAIPGSLAHLEVESLPLPERTEILVRRDRYEACLRSVLARGRRLGVFVHEDDALATRVLLGALNWSVKWYRRDGERSLRSFEGAFAGQLLRGVLRTAEPVAPPRSDLDLMDRLVAEAETELWNDSDRLTVRGDGDGRELS